MKKVIFYIDGFNFYYGLKRSMLADSKWIRAYWIDVVKLCEQFLGQDQQLEKVIYFTATPLSPGKSKRQSAFLNANKALNGDRFEIVRGKYLEKTIICKYCGGDISQPEEKRTDVNISVRMVGDAAHSKADIYALISADSDLIPPLSYILDNYPQAQVKVYFPPADFSKDIRDELFKVGKRPTLMKKSFYFFDRAHMPDEVVVGDDKYTCPDSWR